MKKTWIASLILFLIGLSAASVHAQAYLYVEKGSEFPDHRWKQGEKLQILLSDGEDSFWQKGYFNGGDSAGLVLGTKYYTWNQILAVRYSNGLIPFFGKSALAGAGLFTGVFAVNSLINDDRPILTEGQIYLGAGLLSAGLISKLFWYKVRKMEKGYELRIINLRELEG